MAISSLADSKYPSARHTALVKRTLAAIANAFNADTSEVTPAWLDKWLGLEDTPLEQYPKQLGLSMIAQLCGHISEGHTLLLAPPFWDKAWEPRVRDRIGSLTCHQRMIAAIYLRLRRDLSDRAAHDAWARLWMDVYEAGGDMSLAWKEPFDTNPYSL